MRASRPHKNPSRDGTTRRVVGRPTEYDSDLCPLVVALGATGASLTEIAFALGVHRATLYRWMRAHDEFCDAVTRAREASLSWWLAQGRQGMDAGPAFNTRVFIFMMRNLFPEEVCRRAPRRPQQTQRVSVVVESDGVTD